LPLSAAAQGNLVWEQWQHVPAVFDVAGPMPNGNLLVATGQGLLELAPATGAVVPARVDLPAPVGGAEAYIAFSPGLGSSAMGCSFRTPALYVLKTTSPAAVLAVDLRTGLTSILAPIAGVDTLGGIAFDRFGRFGNRLLVTGPHAGQTVVDAIDCTGKVTVITTSAPAMEGGMEVAPPTFGAYGGDLVVPDELSGNIIAVSPEGTSQVVARSGIAAGGDIGVESVAFIPRGFLQGGGTAYLADRATANNAHAGTDTLLRLSASELRAQGVGEGDLLAASEGGGVTVAIHCGADGSCSNVRVLGQAATAAHVEGHLLLVAANPGPAPSPLPQGKLGVAGRGGVFTYLPYAVGLLAAAGLYLYSRRRWRGKR
jgi:hypothetical protein